MKNSEIEKLNWTGWPIPDQYLIELGRINALWSSLETFLNMSVSKLSRFQDYDEIPFILINHASFPQRVDMIGALCEHLKAEFPHLADFQTVVSKLKSAQRLRNDFAHNGIGYDSATKKAVF